MDTNSQLKKSPSPRRCSKKNAETVLKITANAWWPFNRVDGKLLQKLHKQNLKQTEEDALL